MQLYEEPALHVAVWRKAGYRDGGFRAFREKKDLFETFGNPEQAFSSLDYE